MQAHIQGIVPVNWSLNITAAGALSAGSGRTHELFRDTQISIRVSGAARLSEMCSTVLRRLTHSSIGLTVQ